MVIQASGVGAALFAVAVSFRGVACLRFRSARSGEGLAAAGTVPAAAAEVRLGTGLSGNATRLTAASACPVTQTGVWSLDAEYR